MLLKQKPTTYGARCEHSWRTMTGLRKFLYYLALYTALKVQNSLKYLRSYMASPE